ANNSIGFVAAVNSSALCGFSDWRMPGTDEMYHLGNQTYFPETTSSGFWSASPVADYSNFAWGDSGGYYYYDRNDGRRVRLVRGGQSFGTFVLSLSATGSGSGALSADDG
ncbi:DUF1566 domain-containing protein, partial [bacterium]|nr:DUF1566 domain-containing protein [bacterium]